MASLVTDDATIEELNEAIGYVHETLKTCRTDRMPKLMELRDDLLDAKLDLIPVLVKHG